MVIMHESVITSDG